MNLSKVVAWGLYLMSATVGLLQSAEPTCTCMAPEPARFSPPRFSAPSRVAPISQPFSASASPYFGSQVVVQAAAPEPVFSETIVDRAPLQITVPEQVLNRLLTDERSEIAPVRDVIANADVRGRQATTTRVVVDLRPSDAFAEINLVLTGAVESETVGLTPQAAVNTLGRHEVLAVKPVMFDGHQISTKRPRVWVDVHNEHVGARTALDGTLFGGIARGIAMSTARRQRNQVDAETAELLAARLGPQFNHEADAQLAKFNREWRDGLKARFANHWPQKLMARSTDSQLLLSAVWADAPEVSADFSNRIDTSANRATDGDAITIRLHESVLNAYLRTLNLGGKAMTESELRGTLESLITKLGGRVLARDSKVAAQPLPGAAPLIRLGEKDPVRVSFTEGELRLTVIAGVEVAGQVVLAQDEITVPLSSTVARGEWRVTPGKLAFAKADNGVSLVGMVETLVRGQLAAAMPDVALPDAIPLPSGSGSRASTMLRLARAEASSGWLMLTLNIGSGSQPTREAQPPQPEPDVYVPVEQRRIEPTPVEQRSLKPVPVSPPRLRAPTDLGPLPDRSFFE